MASPSGRGPLHPRSLAPRSKSPSRYGTTRSSVGPWLEACAGVVGRWAASWNVRFLRQLERHVAHRTRPVRLVLLADDRCRRPTLEQCLLKANEEASDRDADAAEARQALALRHPGCSGPAERARAIHRSADHVARPHTTASTSARPTHSTVSAATATTLAPPPITSAAPNRISTRIAAMTRAIRAAVRTNHHIP